MRAPSLFGTVVHTTRVLLQRILVEGDSMRPTLEPGDRLVCVRSRRVRPGDLVAVHDPRDGRLLVKRVASVDPLTVAGDNPDASTDSRSFGAVTPDRVVGRAVYRYWPDDRRGRLPRR
jgi:nickel-type superoxide dismutase maturation protease